MMINIAIDGSTPNDEVLSSLRTEIVRYLGMEVDVCPGIAEQAMQPNSWSQPPNVAVADRPSAVSGERIENFQIVVARVSSR